MKQYIVDAFTDEVFKGNPAAVCVLDKWPKDSLMQSMAIENSLSETAFTVKGKDGYGLRWFTPGGEIDLCGHATLGTAYVLFHFYEKDAESLTFHTMGGTLTVNRKGDLLELVFPAYHLKQVPVTDDMEKAIGVRPLEAWMDRDLLCVLPDERDVIQAAPDQEKVKKLDGLLLHITAKGTKYDCVSRSFAPKLAVPEDPVCGSGHCHIIPYWAKVLGKNDLVAFQASKRTGVLYCTLDGEQVRMAGKGALYSISDVFVKM
ncbi:PhzF family phenazine biosynthesis protein [uncultured Dialister sp.]|uniref:PhzF family phenazine biosynthesis protein n=1 Tax=uncultured Dialister sp. TaxID=278064 RepID=UPI0025F2BD27|nr:PhzF family phenazine biosynthesis protein [uncultured Dialister sp.]